MRLGVWAVETDKRRFVKNFAKFGLREFGLGSDDDAVEPVEIALTAASAFLSPTFLARKVPRLGVRQPFPRIAGEASNHGFAELEQRR